jgi:uncharacterized protein
MRSGDNVRSGQECAEYPGARASFERVEDFDFETASFKTDNRHDYGELRTRAVGFLDGRLHVLVFTERGKDIRVISLRKANRAEMRRYADVKS